MPHNPVQFVANGEDFLQAPEPGRKGPEKDFFEDRDAAFAAHQEVLIAALDTIDAAITAAKNGPATYIRVVLREAALAKSYRPNTALLTPDRFPCVGAGAIGELFFFLPQVHIPTLKTRIRQAEPTVDVRQSKTGQTYRNPSRLRSEVGAIQTIEIMPPALKRSFSAQAAVQSLLDPHTFPGYQVELFEVPTLNEIAADRWGRRELFESLMQVLLTLGNGARSYILPSVGRIPMLEVQLTRSSDAPALVDLSQLATTSADTVPSVPDVDPAVERHEAALNRLAEHPLVRRIDPPVQLVLDQQNANSTPKAFPLPTRVEGNSYPRIGVIDSGVGAALAPWTLARFDHLTPDKVDAVHGSKVAGILIAGQSANGPAIAAEPDGCEVYDLALFPRLPFSYVYRGGFAAFLEEVEQGIREAREDHGVRIFNMSINTWEPVQRHSYSTLAARLDTIADRHGVLIVNSAGNLKPNDARAPWEKSPIANIRYFAARTEPDTICQPTETVRGLSVGALNCPNGPHVPNAPARYSRRGPGLQVGVKPDVAHYGGCGPLSDGEPTGLISATPDGLIANVSGTSFAAPLTARTLAELDAQTALQRAPRTLRALLIHHADTPEPLQARGLKDLARQFTGFGLPVPGAQMLETPDHQITFVFESLLTKGEPKPAIMRFSFAWPEGLVDPDTLACTGRVRMTLVYEPPLDPAFGAEFARVNLDASLKQRQPIDRKDGSPSYIDQTKMLGMPNAGKLTISERALIEHGLKWWPTKKYTANLNQHGSSADWRLEVASLTRAETQFPTDGVPFSLVVTLEDPSGRKPVFQNFRRYLQTRGILIDDIRTVTRVRPRA
jgi:subtilisin family serine protease